MKRRLFEDGARADGRGARDTWGRRLRSGLLPEAHGSSLAEVGEGQVLATATVGGMEDRAALDTGISSAKRQSKKPIVAQYGMPIPAHSLRSTYAMIRHEETFIASLIEASLQPIVAELSSTFPFAVRLNVEVLGAVELPPTAALHALCIALRDAGVPITKTVAGASVGLVQKNPPTASADSGTEPAVSSEYEFLADTTELEDEMVDMQVHLAGTADGISIVHAACQAAGVPLDRAIQAIRFAELQHREAVRQAEEIESAVLKGTSQTFQFGNLSIPTEHIGRVIGSGGSNVKHIQDRTGSKIIGLEDGTFHVFAPSEHAVREALRMVQDSLPPVVKEGERFLAKVVSIKDFGAFVLLPNKAEALLHISQLAHERVRDVSDILKVGDEVEVVVLGSDQRGNIRVSRKAALETAPCSGAASTS